MKLKIVLTPMAHYFLGTERNFHFDQTRRQAAGGYFIRSREFPSQTTLFGTLRYLIGVKDERLRANADVLIGSQSFDIRQDGQTFGLIKGISPLYLMRSDDDGKEEFFVRAPLDHRSSATGKDPVYDPMIPDTAMKKIEVFDFPLERKSAKERIISGYNAKEGLFHGWMALNAAEDKRKLLRDDQVFAKSVEVVSNKKKKMEQGDDSSAFARKEYIRLFPGFHFVFFANLSRDCEYPGQTTAVLGKDSSIFSVEISDVSHEDEEAGLTENLRKTFQNRTGLVYMQSDSYIPGGAEMLYKSCGQAITETDTLRIFETKNRTLAPKKPDDELLNLVKAGSVIYLKDTSCLENRHARTAGMNYFVTGMTTERI